MSKTGFPKARTRSKFPLELIQSDLMGKLPVSSEKSISGDTFVDDYSSFRLRNS